MSVLLMHNELILLPWDFKEFIRLRDELKTFYVLLRTKRMQGKLSNSWESFTTRQNITQDAIEEKNL